MSSCRATNANPLRLPWRRYMGRHNETVIADADGRQVAAWLLDEHAEAIVAARNATHREPERMVPRREPACRSCAKPMNPTPPNDPEPDVCSSCVEAGEPSSETCRFGVQTIGGETTWYATDEEALAAWGPGQRRVYR